MQLQRKVAIFHKHVQDSASDTWTIVHNLFMYPVVDCYTMENSELSKVLPSYVRYISETTCEVKFSYPVTGIAVVS